MTGRPQLRHRNQHHRQALQFTRDHIHALTMNADFFRAFGPPGDIADAAMSSAWPDLRDECFAHLAHRHAGGWSTSQIMPGGWWKYESPEPRDNSIAEAEQLRRLGIDPEREALETNTVKRNTQ